MKTSKNINISIVLGIIACIITVAFRLFFRSRPLVSDVFCNPRRYYHDHHYESAS